MNPKLVLIINMWYCINFHGNELGSTWDFSPSERKGKKPYSDTPSGLFKQIQKDYGEERVEEKK